MPKMYRFMFLECMVFIQLTQLCFACQMEGVGNNWRVIVTENVLDTHIGVVLNRSTTDILGINSVSYTEGLNRGPYVEVKFENSQFMILTNSSFAEYEEYETMTFMRLTVTFICAPGSSQQSSLNFRINIIDTNNNAPQFLPSDIYEFTVMPPLPPGFLVTGCDKHITARDIDLTTRQVNFTIEDNDYFELFYENLTTVPKEFSGTLRVKTLIRSIPNDLSFEIIATDVDETNDPALHTIGKLWIKTDPEFQLPEELQFSKIFYILNYINGNLVTDETIYLTHGYDSQVLFSLEGEHSENFEMSPNDNDITFKVKSALPSEILAEQQIYLIIRAEREHTMGTAATIVIQMPTARELRFELNSYKGVIDGTNLVHQDIFLNQGYGEDIIFGIQGDYVDFFSYLQNGNQLIVSLKSQLPQEIVTANDIITLETTATGDFTNTAISTLIFGIIKDDLTTPVFAKNIYEGNYVNSTFVTIEEITLSQGYDGTVDFKIFGEHADYFRIEKSDDNVVVSLKSTIPEEVIFSAKIFTLYIVATKPNTVGGNAALVIRFPNELIEPAIMSFSKHTYTGTLEDKAVFIENVVLQSGFTKQVRFVLSGVYSNYFTLNQIENIISIMPNEELPGNLETKNIILNLRAERNNAVPVTTTIILSVLKEDIVQPVFEKPYYKGVYTENIGLQFGDVIKLTSGFDKTVSFELEGEHSQWFYITQNEDSVTLHSNITNPIPNDIFVNNKQIIITIIANKPETTAGRATIVVELIAEDRDKSISFERLYYVGTLDNNIITLDTIKLIGSLDDEYTITLHGDMANYFSISTQGEGLGIILDSEPEDSLMDNDIITLEIRATRENTIAQATIVLKIIKENDETPTIRPIYFNRAYYTGQYSTDGLSFGQIISLSDGFDNTVEFHLDGEFSQWFYITQDENSVRLYENSTNTLPSYVLESNNQIIFTVLANKPGTSSAQAAIFIEILQEPSDKIRFDQAYYVGSLNETSVSLDTISLIGKYDDTFLVTLHGIYANYFSITPQRPVFEIVLQQEVTEDLLNNDFITLEIRVSKNDIITTRTTVILRIIKDIGPPNVVEGIQFDRVYYVGSYTSENVFTFEDTITLAQGYDETVEYSLKGDKSTWFDLEQRGNFAKLILVQQVPSEVVKINSQLIFEVHATRASDSATARSTIVITIEEPSEKLSFDRAYYVGSLNEAGIAMDTITLIGNYDDTFLVTLHGNYANYFSVRSQRSVFEIILQREISENLLNNDFITLEIRISKNDAITTRATVILRITADNEPPTAMDKMQFERVYYVGSYSSEHVFTFEDTISLAEGYDETVIYSLEGDQSAWFRLDQTGRTAKLILYQQVPSDVIKYNTQLIFEVHATRASDRTTARSTIIIAIKDGTTGIMKFERQTYVGTIEQSNLNLDPIVLTDGYNDGVIFSLIGELNGYFRTSNDKNVVTLILLQPIPEENIPTNKIITIDIQATSEAAAARATIVLKIIKNKESLENLRFDKPYYSGTYAEDSGLNFDATIRLESGFDERIQFKLEGEHSSWFRLRQSGNSAGLTLSTSIPESIMNSTRQLIFVVYAQRVDSEVILARSVIIIILSNDPSTNVKFDKVLYRGRVENDAVVHERITISEFNGNIQILGEYSQLFRATINNRVVTVTLSATNLPLPISYVALKLVADEESAVLLLDISESDNPVVPPSLSFSSSAYILEADEGSTGFVGRVSATADNGEAVTYSLEIENEYLKQRITINGNGEIHLSAAADLGIYNFKVSARTIISAVTASAAVQLTIIEAETRLNLPALLVLERDEEEPHFNLVTLDREKYPNCKYSLKNIWPINQDWLYVDSEGLHTRSIDREHDSIAFMPVSQVQVELNLNCNERSKRSIDVQNQEYGSNKWVLTESISYNPSRTLVNLIVTDINDNAPEFENDSITVGYPRGDLAEFVLPRALAELKATDADIEENALLRYISSDERVVVSPTSGSVHLRNHVTLEDNSQLVIEAVDRNGTGLRGYVEVTVRLLDRNQIAVMTIPNKFLDDETKILDDLSDAVGYDIKPLRTTVISESRYDNEGDKSRVRRDVNANGASLRLYVYGLSQHEPVDVTQLTADLSNTNIVTVSLARVLSLEDHLDELQICPAFEREIGLLAATVVLAVLLLIIIVAFGIWLYLQRKFSNDYTNFSDQNSLRSRNDSIEAPIVEPMYTTPRLNIEELRKSEKKLQERLDAPKEVTDELPTPKNNEITKNTVVDLAATDSKWPIVIQSIDKLKDNADESDADESDDEFGEKQRPRRKSVVTFNENVEKIIHLEDMSIDGESQTDVEVHKF